MKFTGFAVSLAFAGIVSAAAIPGVPGVGGTVGGVEGAAAGTLAGLTHGAKRQLGLEGAIAPVAESVGSTLNGVTGTAGSAIGTGESTLAGAAGTVEKTVADTVPSVKRQLGAIAPVTEGVGSSLNGVTGTAGSAVGTVESTVGGAAGTAEKAVADTVAGGLGGGLLGARQLGNMPATFEQTIQYALVGLSGNPTGLYGALNNLRTIVNAGDLTNSDLTNLPQAVQDVIAHLSVA